MDKRVFFEKVALMREAQKEYFRTRSHDVLRKSKALEAEIDREIVRVRALGYDAPEPLIQPSLFVGGEADRNRPCSPHPIFRFPEEECSARPNELYPRYNYNPPTT